jgi:glycosyltransferase involved in cell wall biosynthesis
MKISSFFLLTTLSMKIAYVRTGRDFNIEIKNIACAITSWCKIMIKLHGDSPVISVLLSCYNGARWLDEALKSVLSQTFLDFELIIVDDGSTDNSPEIIKLFAEQDSRIIVITKNNSGLADSLNVGIQRARGEWIARLDADDISEPSRLERQLAKATQNPDLVFIGSGLLIIDANGNPHKTYHYPDSHALLVRNLSTGRKFPPHSSAFYRTDVVRSIGGYRPRIKRAQDRDLWLRLSEVGQLAVVDEPLVRIRKHSDQISHEESGRRQIIYSHCAVTSYWIRRMGYSDPINADDSTFEHFHSWMANKLAREGQFNLFEYKLTIIRCFSEWRNAPRAFLLVFFHIFSKPFLLLQYFRVRIFGESITRRFALEWLENHQ